MKLSNRKLYCSMKYFYLIYSSVPSRKLSDEEVEDLLVVARRENELRNITGMLVCFPDMYVQLIEGTEEDIRQLYLNLLNDSRHHHVAVLKQGNSDRRFFPDWSMGYDKKNTNLEDTRKTFDFVDDKVIELLRLLDDGFE